MKKKAFLTISALNYSGAVKVLRDSASKLHPDVPFFYFVIDDYDGRRSKKTLKNKKNLIFFNQLEEFMNENSPGFSLQNMVFPYDVVEASTAVKPMVLAYLMEVMGYEEVIYLDPDILITSSLKSLWDQFSPEVEVLLTPHLTAFSNLTDNFSVEQSVSRSGIFNLGFIGLRKSPQTIEFLQWWASRLVSHCSRDTSHGFFTDQKWIDVAFGAFPKVKVLRDPGLNVAHWNIHERKLSYKKNRYTVDKNKELKFFHFSGFDVKEKKLLSKHRQDLLLAKNPAVKKISTYYRSLLMKEGQSRLGQTPYQLDYFSNGIKIPDVIRKWAQHSPEFMHFEDPYEVKGSNSFFNWMLRSGGQEFCPLVQIVYNMRGDVQAAFPQSHKHYKAQVMNWFVEVGAKEHKVDPRITRLLRLK